jgi:hypothetical protein
VHKTKGLVDANEQHGQSARRPIGYAISGFLLLALMTAGRADHGSAAGIAATDSAETGQSLEDNDSDGLDDRVEDRLAERFAPVVHHGERETSFPVSVEWWLERTHLSTIDTTRWRSRTRRIVTGPLRQEQLLNQVARFNEVTVSSSGSRSRDKRVSFYLEDVSDAARPGTIRPGDWVTYVHSYPNESGGVTLQYWRAYAWNDVAFAGLDVGHGGDWEAVAVHLDASLQPARTTYLDHTGIVDWGPAVRWEKTHPLVWSEEGGHSSYPNSSHTRSTRFIRHATWTGGTATRWDGALLGVSGGLVNVGEKLRPRNGQVFLQYSGLWGGRGRLFLTSGYWGPAFNETGALCADGEPAYEPYARRAGSRRCGRIFLKAWCDGMDRRLNRTLECSAANDVP